MADVAVYSAGWLATPSGGRFKVPAPSSALTAIATLAVRAGVSVVYALDEVVLAGGDGWSEPKVTGGELPTPWRVHISTDVQAIVCRPGGGRIGSTVAVVLPRYDEEGAAGPWLGLEPRPLLYALGELERVLGVPWSHSTGATAQSLILATHELRKGGLALDRDPVCPEPGRAATLEQPFVWRRELTKEESAGVWVHAYDANAQYLAAWQAVELGFGVPLHQVRPRFDASRAGLWRVEAAPHAPPSLLPAPWLEREWFTTPTITRMLEVCEGFDAPLIAEAWVWPRKSRYLRGAAERIRDARASWLDAIAAAGRIERHSADLDAVAAAIGRRVIAETVLEAAKGLYKRGTQRFGMVREGSSPWYRPEWGNTIRAVARCNLHRRLTQLGRAPFAINVDGLAFVTDEPDPVTFAESIRLPLGSALGAFRPEGSARMAPEVAELSAPKVFRFIDKESNR